MIKCNENEEEIEVSEILSFRYHVQPIYDSLIEFAKELLEEEEIEETDGYKEFINYKLNHDDKMQILHNIEDIYCEDSEYYSVSLHDEKRIRQCLIYWIDDTFDVNLE